MIAVFFFFFLTHPVYFKIFPDPSAGPALSLTLRMRMPPLTQPQVNLAFAKRAEPVQNHRCRWMGYIP